MRQVQGVSGYRCGRVHSVMPATPREVMDSNARQCHRQ
ncbi:hypothetical protein D8I24_5165 [Cupriavidus necator H850]|nr:hypothetical protein D8I24_5165 [Cupriavidus necator H850]